MSRCQTLFLLFLFTVAQFVAAQAPETPAPIPASVSSGDIKHNAEIKTESAKNTPNRTQKRVKVIVLDKNEAQQYLASHIRHAAVIILVVFFCIFLYIIRQHHIASSINRLRSLLNLLPFQSGAIDTHGNILFYRGGANPDIDSDTIPKHLADLPSELQHELSKLLQEVFETGKQKTSEYSVFGQYYKIDVWQLPPSTFNVPAVMWLTTDITQLYTEHHTSMLMEQRFQQTMNSIVDGVISTNFDGIIVNANPAAERLLGSTHKELLGRKLTECVISSNSDCKGITSILSGVLQTGKDQSLGPDYTLRLSDGTLVEIDGTISPIKTADNMIVGAVFFFRNATRKPQKPNT